MLAFILRRLMFLPVIILGATLILFLMLQLLDPYQRLSLYIQDPSQLKDPEQMTRLIDKYGLNDPWYVQYAAWVGKVMRGDLGWSETAKTTVAQGFLIRFPATAELALYAFFPIVIFAVWLGVQAAVHHNRAFDQTSRVVTIVTYSLPTFVLGLLLLSFFYGWLSRYMPPLFEGWFAPGRLSPWAEQVTNSDAFHKVTGMMTVDGLLNLRFDVFWNALGHLILPVAGLALGSWAAMLRVMRSAMLETLQQDYVRTARAKGVREKIVVKKHARRNALIPIITYTGFLVVGLLSGVVITETIFSYPGIGSWLVAASLQLDVAAVLGLLTFVTVLYLVVNLIVDIVYAVVDPRIRLT